MIKPSRSILILIVVLVFAFSSGFLAHTGWFHQDEILVVSPAEELFSPEAENWRIPFALVSTAARGYVPPVSLNSILVDGEPLHRESVNFLYGNLQSLPVVPAGRHLPSNDLLEWHRIHQLVERGAPVASDQLTRFSKINNQISRKAGTIPDLAEPANELIIPVSLLDLDENETYQLEVTFTVRGKNETISFSTTVTVAALPGYPGNSQWVGGDLHIHSTWSDGRRSVSQLRNTMQDRGYFFVYLSDGHHTKQLFDDRWSDYKAEVYQVSNTQISMFPGVETAVGPINNEQGHLLVYGTNASIAGLEEHTLGPQEMINAALSNEPTAPTSSSIAHPTGSISWDDFTVFGYSGLEMMSGAIQLYFDVYSSPGRLYRQEIMRHRDYAIEGGTFPSPRSGTDWHGYWFEPLRNYVTWVYLDEHWDNLNYHSRKAAVDQKLFDGAVSISRRGSLGFFTLDGNPVGSVIRNVPAGTTLPLHVEYRSTQRGTVYIYLLRNNLAETVFYRSASMSVGETRNWQSEITFPGGRQLYWLYVEGPDYAYSSPIFVSED